MSGSRCFDLCFLCRRPERRDNLADQRSGQLLKAPIRATSTHPNSASAFPSAPTGSLPPATTPPTPRPLSTTAAGRRSPPIRNWSITASATSITAGIAFTSTCALARPTLPSVLRGYMAPTRSTPTAFESAPTATSPAWFVSLNARSSLFPYPTACSRPRTISSSQFASHSAPRASGASAPAHPSKRGAPSHPPGSICSAETKLPGT